MFSHAELLKQTSSLNKFAYKLTRNRDDAEDLLQSTIVTALEKQQQFEQGTNLFSWTSRIMFNAFVSNYRHNSRFETQYDPQWYIDQECVDATQENDAELSLVFDAMLSLSEDHREILILVCIDGMRYAEVAEKLQIPVGTVRSRLSRAREGLQELLNIPRHRNAASSPASVEISTRKEATLHQEAIIRKEATMSENPELINAVAANERRTSLQRIARWHT
jgi:RNA polymerase sigma-70 factor (ECF subfamily)